MTKDTRGPFIGRHDPFMTPEQERQGYPQARERLKGYATSLLMREYLEAVKDSLGRVFGHNAAKNADVLAEELLERRVREIPNLFGPIPVRADHRKRKRR